MTKKTVFTAILVTFTLLFQYGCKTTEVATEQADTEQAQVTVEQVQAVQETNTETPVPVDIPSESPSEIPVETSADSEDFVLRVDCGGYEEYTDKAGNVWQADQEKTEDNKWGAVYGSVIGRSGLGIEGTDCPIIYENERYSMDAYEFEVPNGKYTVTLHFAETYEGIYGVGERVFGVSINGETVLEDFDPYADAGEFNTPAVKKFGGIEPKDGKIVIGFEYGVENPQINGIEIVPGDSAAAPAGGEQIAIRVNCGTEDGAEAYTDEDGKVWQPDRIMSDDLDWGAMDGEIIQRATLEIKDTKSPGIYQSETYSMSAYKFKVPAGKYTVTLHFAETYDGIYGEGERVFGVSINEKTVLEDMDPMKEAGEFAKAVVKEFKGIEPVDGVITIGFEYGVENPQINGIEVVSEGAAGTTAASEKFVLRVDCGGYEEYTDKAGNLWQADQEKTDDNKWGAVYGSVIGRSGLGIEGDCPLIYENERYSMDAYEFEVPNGKYTVTLHFAETYEGIYDVGERVFSVAINGKEVLKDFDPYKDAGEFNKPSVKENKSVEVTDGKIEIGFTYGVENPEINGIEIVSE